MYPTPLKLTSVQWAEMYEMEEEILDPDGWDRENFQDSFYEEPVTENEFWRRVNNSTLQIKGTMML